MKKRLLLFGALIVVNIVSAQSLAILEAYQLGGHDIVYLENLMETRKGDIIAPVRLFDINGQNIDDFGYCFLKLSRRDATIIDSTIVKAEFTNVGLLEPNPQGVGYLFINEEYDYDCECSKLKIRKFDENFNFLDDQQTILPFEDTIFGSFPSYLPEGEDFIMCYQKSGHLVLARFGIDGEQKDKNVYDTLMGTPNYVLCNLWGLRLWNQEPREYAVAGYAEPGNGDGPVGFLFVIDSLLQVKNNVRYEYEFQDQTWFRNNDMSYTMLDDGSYLISTPYNKWLGNHMTFGVQVTKRDKTSHEILKTVYFPYDGQDGSPYVADLIKDENGNVFLGYGDVEGFSGFTVVKMDSDLNGIWKRYCLSTRPWDNSSRMTLLKNDGPGVAIPIFNFMVNPGYITVVIVNDDYDGLDEQDGISIRPYAFWPNPAKGILNLQYSPDVTPKKIELYDLQGRLVRSQTMGLESIDMEGLAAGTYMMRVTLEGGKVFSDKVVKE